MSGRGRLSGTSGSYPASHNGSARAQASSCGTPSRAEQNGRRCWRNGTNRGCPWVCTRSVRRGRIRIELCVRIGAHGDDIAAPDDCDFLHFSNSSYPGEALDCARMRMAINTFSNFLRATHPHLTRETPMLARCEVRASVGAWDDKWIWVVSRFVGPAPTKSKSRDNRSGTSTPALESERPNGTGAPRPRGGGEGGRRGGVPSSFSCRLEAMLVVLRALVARATRGGARGRINSPFWDFARRGVIEPLPLRDGEQPGGMAGAYSSYERDEESSLAGHE
ncbi:hypothetical protein FB451DRAFT_1177180 [Mycena latifolia]|nr:hypothetical protein FB451DRAFT_1177180 [Mycena latifolia]